jgi:hypothetical protein
MKKRQRQVMSFRTVHFFKFLVIGLMMLPISQAQAFRGVNTLDFSLIKNGQADSDGPVILVIGGIQGDEPGGFNAASLLTTHYDIQHGQLWVVPNLNFPSIIKRSRGIHGDMNRKFMNLNKHDPEYESVEKIKAIIKSDEVDLILNLHDGSGFYSPVYINKSRNAWRWGQSIIIDQETIGESKYNQLGTLARAVASDVNSVLPLQENHLKVRNTKTYQGDKEMEKTLTYFAVRHNKAAFGVEASKSFPTHKRAYFHLRVVEAFMNQLGVKFSRDFALNEKQVKMQIDNNIKLAFYGRKIILDMANARSRLGYVPFQKGRPIEFAASNPLVAIVDEQGNYKVRYGNRSVSHIHPEFYEYDHSLTNVRANIDGKIQQLKLGSIVPVNKQFSITPIAGYRVNVIGYTHQDRKDESGIEIKRAMFRKRFSVDKQAQRFRVEFYQQDRYCGMLLVDFDSPVVSQAQQVTHSSNL